MSKFDKALTYPVYVRCADMQIRELHFDIFAWVCDLPEAWKLTGVYHQSCHVCEVKKDEMGDLIMGSKAKRRAHEEEYVSKLLQERQSTSKRRRIVIDNDLKGRKIHRYANVLEGRCQRFNCVQVDLLHQLYRGCFEKLKESLKSYLKTLPNTQANKALNAITERMTSMPPFTGLANFSKSYYDMGRTTARHHRDIMKMWLGVVTDLPGIEHSEGDTIVSVFKHYIDFVFYARKKEITQHEIDDWLDTMSSY